MTLVTTRYRVVLQHRGVRGEPVEHRWFHRSDVVRFLENVKLEPLGCWEWQGSVSNTGYGLWRQSSDERAEQAHRVSHKLLKGPIGEGLSVDHLCENKLCVNPDHLEAVSQAENVQRGKQWTACEKWHPGVSPRWGQRRSGGAPYCKECNRVRAAELRGSVKG